jgi:hypothetical protein
MADGRLGKCKECTKKDSKHRHEKLQSDPEWTWNEKQRQREKEAKRRKDGKVTAKYEKLKSTNHPYKKMATSASQYIECPKDHDNHHWSYNEEHWKCVFPLTRQDHAKIHRYMTFDFERLMYRTVHGVLLDSRDAAEAYYEKVLLLTDTSYNGLSSLA